MTMQSNQWMLLVYKIPTQPTRLRLQIWRKLQRMGAVYLQDAVCLLPSRPELDENMQYGAENIQEMGRTCHLFSARATLPGWPQQVPKDFRAPADNEHHE